MAGTVTVCCKLPHGLILHLDDWRDVQEATPLGNVTVKRAFRRPNAIEIKGCARPFGEGHDVVLTGGYGLTHGVDAEFWNEWLSTHKDFAPVKSGAIFAVPKADDAKGEARKNANVKS